MAALGSRSARVWASVAVAVALAAAGITALVVRPGAAPAGQPPLARLGDLARFRADFDAACREARLLVLLSPT